MQCIKVVTFISLARVIIQAVVDMEENTSIQKDTKKTPTQKIPTQMILTGQFSLVKFPPRKIPTEYNSHPDNSRPG